VGKNTAYATDKNPFNFKLIAVGLIFLIDFNVNTVDIFPDFIALIFISAGIGKIYYISDYFAKAKNYINYFYIAAFIKFAWNIIYFILGIKNLDHNTILLLTTLFSAFELILSILIFTNIFKGLENFFQQNYQNNHNDYNEHKDHNEQNSFMERANQSGYILLFLKIFIVAKFILGIFVQIPVLLTDINWDRLSVYFNAYLDTVYVKNLFLSPCFIIQTLLGIFLLSFVFPFFFGISKDKDFNGFLKSKINRALSNNHLYVLKQTFNSAFLFFIIGSVFFIDLQFDNINFLPDFMICIIFLIGIFIISRTAPEIKSKKIIIYLSVNLFISTGAYITGTVYKINAVKSFTNENIFLLAFLKLSSNILYHVSVIIFFLIFMEFYIYIKKFQQKHLEFAVRYFNKYLTLSEKNFDKNKNIIIKIAAAACCVKTLSPVLPQSGIALFCHSLILIAFVIFIIKGLYTIKDFIYSYYN